MTPAIDQAILAIGNSLTASLVVKATIVISLALIAATFARRSRASIRHTILTAGFAVLLALPIATSVAPPLHIALPVAQDTATLAANSAQSFDETSLAQRAMANAPSSAEKSKATSFSLFDLLFIAWAIGAAIFVAPVIVGLWQVRSLRRTALPWSHGESIAITLASELKISRRIEVLLHESVPGPMTCGIFHPAIVCPVEAENWDAADLNRAVAHELEHVRRADWLTHCLARIVCAAYWFHPFVWIAWRQLTLEAERACDDAVLAHSEATAYAEQLVALARHLTAAHKSPLLAMASRSDLTSRINAVLDSRQSRGRTGKLVTTLACTAAVFAIAASPVQIITAGPQSSGQDWEEAAGGKLSFEVASVKQNTAGLPPSGDNPRANFSLDSSDVYSNNGGLVDVINFPLFSYIGFAYKLSPFARKILQKNLPRWALTERFDIQARGPAGSTKDQMRLMMQSLLADRFRLAVHMESQNEPVFALVLVSPGRTGPQLQPHSDNPPCTASSALQRQASTPSGYPMACGQIGINLGGTPPNNRPQMLARSVTIQQIADELTIIPAAGFDRPLMDDTGLTGKFDFKLSWTPLPGPNAAPDVTGPIFLENMKDQLGLKLEPKTAPTQELVIDHIEPPTPN